MGVSSKVFFPLAFVLKLRSRGDGRRKKRGVRLNADVNISYEHHNVAEPAILLGGAFVIDVPEASKD